MEQKIYPILPENLWNIIENYNEYSLEKTLEEHYDAICSVYITPNKRSDFDRERNGKRSYNTLPKFYGNMSIHDLKKGK